jgi:uncharacterized membrane protein HdeD (DUF308 family)
MVSAVVIAGLMLMLGIGNLFNPEDTGPLYGKLLLLAVMATGAGLIGYGLVLRRRDESRGNKTVAVGVLPGMVGLAFFWFPPAVAVGVLAIATSWTAYREGVEREPSFAAS